MGLPLGLEVAPFGQPVLGVAQAELFGPLGEFFQSVEVPRPENLLPEDAKEAFDAAVAFGIKHKSG